MFCVAVSFGPWWGHVKSYWEHRDDPNLLVVSYEDMVQVRGWCEWITPRHLLRVFVFVYYM